MSLIIRPRRFLAASALAAALSLGLLPLTGCQSSPLVNHQREVAIYETPNYGAADAVGYLVFVLDADQAKQRPRTRLIATPGDAPPASEPGESAESIAASD